MQKETIYFSSQWELYGFLHNYFYWAIWTSQEKVHSFVANDIKIKCCHWLHLFCIGRSVTSALFLCCLVSDHHLEAQAPLSSGWLVPCHSSASAGEESKSFCLECTPHKGFLNYFSLPVWQQTLLIPLAHYFGDGLFSDKQVH